MDFETLVIDGLKFVMTSCACPEQYDVYKGDEAVGYVRLRHGNFSVRTADQGVSLYFNRITDEGCFDSSESRAIHLGRAACAINRYIAFTEGENVPLGMTPRDFVINTRLNQDNTKEAHRGGSGI